jgi:hypothetical protein
VSVARRNDPDDPSAKKRKGPQIKQDQEEEQEVEAEKAAPESETSRAQNQLGNQGVMAIMGMSTAQPGSAGAGMAMLPARETEKDGPALGGDDDPLDDDPMTIEDLTRSWNPRIKKAEDKAAFKESMPDDDLPPEDEEWLARVRDAPPPDLPPNRTKDGLLQPSVHALGGSLGPWVRSVRRWAGHTLERRAAIHLVSCNATCLQDPYGRVFLSRARAGAIASWMMLDAPIFAREPDLGTAAFLDACFELSIGHRRMQEVREIAEASGQQLPIAAQLAAEVLGPGDGVVEPKQVTRAVLDHLLAALNELLDFVDAVRLVPALREPEAVPVDPDDDPLGLDQILAEAAGGPPDLLRPVFLAAVQGAERLAGACARTRIAFAGVAVVVSDVADDWSQGTPHQTLQMLLNHLDAEIQKVLQLLVEIARAAQTRAVPPRGLQNGLTRAAKQLNKARAGTTQAMAMVVAAIVPGSADVYPPVETPDDPLESAWSDGEPAAAMDWLRSLPSSLERDTTAVFTKAAVADHPSDLLRNLAGLTDALANCQRPALSNTALTVLAPTLLWAGRADGALQVGKRLHVVGLQRRNGIVLADAAMLQIEALRMLDRAQEAQELRFLAGCQLYHIGARGGLSLLARWHPPETFDEFDAAPT